MAEKPNPILQIHDLKKTYQNEKSSGPDTEWILNEVTLELAAGESLAIVGPSGSGKSSLLNIVGGLDKPTSGDIYLKGEDIASYDEEALAEMRRNKIGFIFQLHHLLPQCSVIENVLIPNLAAAGAIKSADVYQKAEKLLERVGLGHRMHHMPGQLSGGEKQRVAVVRALINDPILLLADEPTGSLDQNNAENLTDLLCELNRDEGLTLIMVTHDQRLAAKLGRVAGIKDGQLLPEAELAGA